MREMVGCANPASPKTKELVTGIKGMFDLMDPVQAMFRVKPVVVELVNTPRVAGASNTSKKRDNQTLRLLNKMIAMAEEHVAEVRSIAPADHR